MGLALGCGPVVGSSGSEGGGASTTAADADAGATTRDASSGADVTTTPVGSTTFGGQTETGDDTTTVTTNSSAIYGGSIGDPDGGGVALECGVMAQDCAKDEKCAPWANDGGSLWNAARCVPLDPDPRSVGEPCTAEGSFVSGIDDCDVGAVCIGSDAETLEGVCIEFCSGVWEAPVCDETANAACVVVDEYFPLCQPMCDPLLGDCDAGETCIGGLDAWGCVPSGDIPVGEPCEVANACQLGLVCAPDEATCAEVCDLAAAEPDLACPDDQTCAPLYDVGDAPAGYEDVGICRSPS